MKNRREFIKTIGKVGAFALASAALPSCNLFDTHEASKYKISLAQWSLHSAFFKKELSNLDFPKIAKSKYGIDAVEYVSQFFQDKAEDEKYLAELLNISHNEGVYNHLIMVDLEGSLASTNTKARNTAVNNHYKWVDAAKFLGCKSIRVNLHGEGSDQDWLAASIEGLGKLTEYGEKSKINIIVENHGQWSSKGTLLAQVVKQVNNEWCGTLPDFGNFCIKRRDGDLWESPCIETYDKYKGVEVMLPYAKGISAKTIAFDKEGNETTIDFGKMFDLIKASNYTGYIGIEYEGGIDEDAGIKLTKKLIEKHLA